MASIALLGYGTVGSGVYEILTKNKETISKKAGKDITVKRILDLREFKGTPVENIVVHDINVILEDNDIEVVVEAMGGDEPAYTYAMAALKKGKSYCTSNKVLVANHGPELLKVAKENNCNFLFEASVGGGIPIIRPLNHSLTPEEILEIDGILNGTTNYILTRMNKEGLPYSEILKDAQALGFAEKDPTADVEGFDACRKIAILTSLAYGKNVKFEDIHTEGITKISNEDFKYAEAMNKGIKLLARSWRENGKQYAIVAPYMVCEDCPLSFVSGVINAILVKGNMLGDAMFYGSGAGSLPTASAVVSDIVEAVKNKGNHIPVLWEDEAVKVCDHAEIVSNFFVRVSDTVSKDDVKKTFSDVSFCEGVVPSEYAFVVSGIKEGDFYEKVKVFDAKQILRVM